MPSGLDKVTRIVHQGAEPQGFAIRRIARSSDLQVIDKAVFCNSNRGDSHQMNHYMVKGIAESFISEKWGGT
ncbi:hypothetical protein PTKU46_94000 [Paraburkholderia terrae]